MGLDNGICVKRNKYSNQVKALEKLQCGFDKEHLFDFDICYWRKCWNVRQDILEIAEGDQEGGCFELDRNQILDIIDLLKSYNKKTWNVAYSIWSWEDHKKVNRRHIKHLKILAKAMRKYPKLEVYFYDSY